MDGTHEPHVGHLRGVRHSMAAEDIFDGFGFGRWRLAHRGVHGLEYQVNQSCSCWSTEEVLQTSAGMLLCLHCVSALKFHKLHVFPFLVNSFVFVSVSWV